MLANVSESTTRKTPPTTGPNSVPAPPMTTERSASKVQEGLKTVEIWPERESDVGVEAAREAGENGADQQGDHLVLEHLDAGDLGGLFIVTDRYHGQARSWSGPGNTRRP